MTVRLYDTRAQALRDFEPLQPGKVGMYVCGPTVQSSPHIGHLRSALAYDLWRRWLSHRGYDVTFVRNVTDIDDKILVNASEHEQWWALAYRIELEFTAGYNALGMLPPTYEPRATASVPQMQDIIATLIEKGHAYAADDGTGDVYFDVKTWSTYGELTNQKLDDMSDSPDAATRGKRDARDFALWKGTKAGEPESASWASPWGAGRPGWHIECSAMSKRYLGAAFDIHGGGLDLRFPHHENELAQSTAAGDAFATYWVHNGLVNIEGQKMSKSLGNSVYADNLFDTATPMILRYYFANAHYRSTIDFRLDALAEARASYERISTFLENADFAVNSAVIDVEIGVVPDAFGAAMDDDLNTPQAIAVLHEVVSAGNLALEKNDLDGIVAAYEAVLGMTHVLGIHPFAEGWPAVDREKPIDWKALIDLANAESRRLALDTLITRMLDRRQQARASKDYAESDRIRDELLSAGIAIDDTPSGPKWSIDG